MLCQYCGKNEATTHVKKIVNGTATEVHLCSSCAKSLGYGSMFDDLSFSFGDLLGGFFGDSDLKKFSSNVVRCEKCGSTFNDIARTGKVGCADCYKKFYDKLLPSIIKIHGNTAHQGKVPNKINVTEEKKQPTANENSAMIDKLKDEMTEAINEQNFERAAILRDQIKQLEQENK